MTRAQLLGARGSLSCIRFLPDRVIGIDIKSKPPREPAIPLDVLHWSFAGGEPFRREPLVPETKLVTSRSHAHVLALCGHGKSLHRYDVETNRMELLVDGVFAPLRIYWTPVVRSPDESRIAVALDECGVGIVELATGAITRLDMLPPDAEPFGWDREGLIACEPPPWERPHGSLWRVSGDRAIAIDAPIWESPDGTMRVRPAPNGLAIERGAGWHDVELPADIRKHFQREVESHHRVPHWMGPRHWRFGVPRALFALETGTLTELDFVGRDLSASADGSMLAVETAHDLVEIVAIPGTT